MLERVVKLWHLSLNVVLPRGFEPFRVLVSITLEQS